MSLYITKKQQKILLQWISNQSSTIKLLRLWSMLLSFSEPWSFLTRRRTKIFVFYNHRISYEVVYLKYQNISWMLKCTSKLIRRLGDFFIMFNKHLMSNLCRIKKTASRLIFSIKNEVLHRYWGSLSTFGSADAVAKRTQIMF